MAPNYEQALTTKSTESGPLIVYLVANDEGKPPEGLYDSDLIKAVNARQLTIAKVIYSKDAKFVTDNDYTSPKEGFFGVDPYGNSLKNIGLNSSGKDIVALAEYVKKQQEEIAKRLNKIIEKAQEYENKGDLKLAASKYKEAANKKYQGWPQYQKAKEKVEQISEKTKESEAKSPKNDAAKK